MLNTIHSQGAVMIVIVWLLDLQLHMQSMPITTNIVRSNFAHEVVYSIQHYVIKFASDPTAGQCFFPCTPVSSTK